MIEINVVREKYASMSDSELISFAQYEASQLTEAGHHLLKEELVRRKLNPGIIDFTETEKKSLTDALEHADDHYTASNWLYLFDQKEYGKSNEDIISGLIESGMEETLALEFILKLETAARQRLKKAEQERLIGSLILISGVAVTFLPLSMPANRLTYIIAGCAILFG